jgi:hypothetical protein
LGDDNACQVGSKRQAPAQASDHKGDHELGEGTVFDDLVVEITARRVSSDRALNRLDHDEQPELAGRQPRPQPAAQVAAKPAAVRWPAKESSQE